MSYAISVRGVDREAIKDAIAKELDDQTKDQQFHKLDKQHVLRAVNAFVDIHMSPGENEQIVVNVSGSIGGETTEARRPKKVARASQVSISVRIASIDN